MITIRDDGSWPGFRTWNLCVLPTVAHKGNRCLDFLSSSFISSISGSECGYIFVWPRSPRPFNPALSGSPIEVGCTVSPEVGPGKLLLLVLVLVGGGWKTKLAIRFNAKETVGSHQCWCELVQRKTGIKVMSSGSVYAESIHFLGKHTFTWSLRWDCKTRQLARWC